MAKIILEKSKCIGCGSCQVLCPKFFEIKDSKAHLKGSQTKSDNEEMETAEIDDCVKEAASACPMECIRIEN